MTKILALLSVLALALGACAQPIDASVDVDPVPAPAALAVPAPLETLDVQVQVSTAWLLYRSVDYVSAIVAATEQWNRATAGRLHMHVDMAESDAGTGVWLRPATSADVAADPTNGWALGTTFCAGCYPVLVLLNGGVIGVRAEDTGTPAAELIQAVVMHELGHVLGLGHLETGLMYRNNEHGTSPCVDAVTLAAFCQLRGCSSEAAPTCPRNAGEGE